MGPQHHIQHETDTAMGVQPLILPCPTCEKTDPTSVDQAIRHVSLCRLPPQVFLDPLANRLYLPHGLG